jgi:hypothetical protein
MFETQRLKNPSIITSKTMLFVGITVNLMGMMFSDTGEYSGAAIFCKNQHFIKT